MSNIPSSAMPHAKASEEPQQDQAGDATIGERAGKLAEQAGDRAGKLAEQASDYARENPKTAIAAGVALAAGVIAAAAIPLVRGRSSSDDDSKKSGGTKKPAAKKS